MRLADDAPNERLSDVVIAHRGAQLCRIAEEAFAQYSAWHPEAPAPVYIIGSEVPIPGGAQENEDSVTVTAPEDCEATLSTSGRRSAPIIWRRHGSVWLPLWCSPGWNLPTKA